MEIEQNEVQFWSICFSEFLEILKLFHVHIIFLYLISCPCGGDVLNFHSNVDLLWQFDDTWKWCI